MHWTTAAFSDLLTRGVDTQLLREFDDDGLMLSGGESQKVAVARAFYKDCPFVILDEPLPTWTRWRNTS